MKGYCVLINGAVLEKKKGSGGRTTGTGRPCVAIFCGRIAVGDWMARAGYKGALGATKGCSSRVFRICGRLSGALVPLARQ